MIEPDIFRKRLVIEGNSLIGDIDSVDLVNYINEFSYQIGMSIVYGPFTHHAQGFGLAAYAHWTTSGIHVYTWDNSNFISIDIYTCQDFNTKQAVEFTHNYFTFKEYEYKEMG